MTVTAITFLPISVVKAATNAPTELAECPPLQTDTLLPTCLFTIEQLSSINSATNTIANSPVAIPPNTIANTSTPTPSNAIADSPATILTTQAATPPSPTPPSPTPPNTNTNTSSLTTAIPGLNPPEFLNLSPNALLFPTISSEVQIKITEPITLEQAVILARRNAPTVNQAQLAIERSRSRLRETYAAEFPTGTANFDFTRSDSAAARVSANRSGINQSTVTTSAQATLELNYDLYTGGRRPATIALAEAQLRNSQLALETLLVQLHLDVANDYYSLQQADAQLRITQSSVTQAERSLRDAQLREQAGVGTRFEVLQADVSLANARQDERNALAQQLIARRQIAQRLNLPQTATVVAADEIKPLGDWQLNLEESIVLALKNRAEIEQQLVAIEQSTAQQRIATADTLPQISLFANYSVLGNLNDGVSTAGGGSVGIRAQWTFFDAGAARARIAQQEANITSAQSGFADQRNQIRFQVEQAYYNLQANRDNISTADQAVVRATEGLRLARLRFQAGVGTQSEVITAQTDLTRAEVNQLTAIVGFNRSLASLQRNVSNLDSQLIDQP